MSFYEFIILIITFWALQWIPKKLHPVMLFLSGLIAFQKNILQIETAIILLSVVLIYELFKRSLSTSLPVMLRTQAKGVSYALWGTFVQIALGTAAAHLLFPSLGWGLSLLLMILLTPTEAPLRPSFPALNGALQIESHLTSIGAPLLAIPLTYALYLKGGNAPAIAYGQMLLVQIGGALFLGGACYYLASKRSKFVLFFLPFFLYIASTQLGMNGFIPIVVCGLLIGNLRRSCGIEFLRQGRREGLFLLWLPFFFLAPPVVEWGAKLWDAKCVFFALLYLLPIRFVAVWVAAIGSGFSTRMKLYMWLTGSKSGVAIALLYIIGVAHASPVLPAGMATLVVSVLLNSMGGLLLKGPREEKGLGPVVELCR